MNVPIGMTIVDFLSTHNQGRDAHGISEDLVKLVAAVREHRRAGSLTITIAIDPVEKREGAVMTTVKSKLKEPRKTQADLFFASSEGVLTKHDPRHIDMFEDYDVKEKRRAAIASRQEETADEG